MSDYSKLNYGGDLMIFSSSGATLQPIAFSTSAKLTINLNTLEISSKDSGYWEESQAGKMNWEMSTDALLNFEMTGSTNGFEDLYNYMIARQPINVSFAKKTGTAPNYTVDGTAKQFTGEALITSFDIQANDNEYSTASISLKGTGALTLS
jgi:predicted secreted protein